MVCVFDGRCSVESYTEMSSHNDIAPSDVSKDGGRGLHDLHVLHNALSLLK